MKMKKTLFVNGLALFTASLSFMACGNAGESEVEATDTTASSEVLPEDAAATLSGTVADTSVSGTVRFVSQPDGKVKMNLEVTVEKMAGKSVAVHIHEHSDCGDHGTHAGGHWNPTNENHGKWGEGSFHSGDFGNISLDASGKGTLEITSDRWSVGGDSTTNVVNKAIIVHSGVDDYTSQPSGNSGSRIGCGVIQQ